MLLPGLQTAPELSSSQDAALLYQPFQQPKSLSLHVHIHTKFILTLDLNLPLQILS